MTNLGDNIRYFRLEHDMSQEDLANALGYKSFTTIQKWESGVAEPPVHKLLQIAQIFHVDIGALTEVTIDNAQENEVPSFVGERIRACRKQLGLTQTALAEKVGVSKQTLNKYETGIVINIPAENIKRLARVMCVSPGYLIGFEEDVTIATREFSSEEQCLMSTYQELTKEDQTRLWDYIGLLQRGK